MKRTMGAASAVALLTATLASCARPPEEIQASYVSPVTYQSYSCSQLAQEATRVSNRAAEAMGIQEEQAHQDAVAMGVGLILFWPALLFIRGGNTTEAEIASLKGQMDAIEQVSIAKNCPIVFQQQAPTQ